MNENDVAYYICMDDKDITYYLLLLINKADDPEAKTEYKYSFASDYDLFQSDIMAFSSLDPAKIYFYNARLDIMDCASKISAMNGCYIATRGEDGQVTKVFDLS